MLGWRKLLAWFLVYVLVGLATWRGLPIDDNAADLIKWVTGFFFGANVLKPLAQGIKVNLGPAKD